MRNTPLLLAALTLAAGSADVLAQSHTVYLGGVYAQVDSKAPALQGGDAVPAPGALLDVGDGRTIGFGYVYRPSEQLSYEVVLGIPPTHKTYGEGFLLPFGQVASVKQVAPTAFVNYHPAPWADGRIKPFVGVGLNFTRFLSLHQTAAGNAATGGPTKIEMSDSWGLAVHVGASVPIDKRWSITGAIAHADVQSDVKLTTATFHGDVIRTTHITFRPVVYTLAVGYDF